MPPATTRQDRMTQEAIRTQPMPFCPLCKQKGILAYREMRDRLYKVPGLWNFLRCVQCDIFWLDPRPIANDISKCYPNRYFTHHVSQPLSLGSTGFKRQFRAWVLSTCFGYPLEKPSNSLLQWLIRAIMLVPTIHRKLTLGLGPLLLPYRSGGRILDIGCGNGVYLAFMKQLGWEVAGIEIDPVAAEIAKTHFSIPIHVGSLENAPFSEASFDAVTMSHVIEHVEDPVAFVRLATYYLKPGGWLVIITPNAASLGVKVFGRDWYAFDPPRHFFLFTSKSLKKCIEQVNSFRQIKIFSLTRKSRKIYMKFVLVRRTGWFRHPLEKQLLRDWRIRFGAKVFEWLEQFGNPFFQWGEEIACVAIKK